MSMLALSEAAFVAGGRKELAPAQVNMMFYTCTCT